MNQKIATLLFSLLCFQMIASDAWSSRQYPDERWFIIEKTDCKMNLGGKFNRNFASHFDVILPEKLTSLELKTGFDQDAIEASDLIIRYLKNDNTLQHLDISGDCLKNKGVLDAIFQKKSLTYLSINSDLDQDPKLEKYLSKLIGKNETLKLIRLLHHDLYLKSDKCGILPALQQNKALEEFHLEGGGVENVEHFKGTPITDLCNLLGANSTLKKLSLIDQLYDDDAVTPILEALEKNSTLLGLDMSNNEFSDTGKAAFQQWNQRGKCQIKF